MAGHSKWKQIKYKKGIADKKRGQLFSKLSRLITLAVAEGGGLPDPDKNVKLRLAVEKAHESNMPKENISRAIEKAIGTDRELFREAIYEGFGPTGVNLMIHTTTDNLNRTLSEVRNVLDKNGGKLGAQGSVAYLFTKCASISFDKTGVSEEQIIEFASAVSALDIDQDADTFTVYVPFENMGHITEAIGDLKSNGPAELDFKPQNIVKISNEGDARRTLNLIEALENLDDVQRVYSNFDIPEEFMKS